MTKIGSLSLCKERTESLCTVSLPAHFSFQLSIEGLASQHSQGLTQTHCYYPMMSVTLGSTLVVYPWSLTDVLYTTLILVYTVLCRQILPSQRAPLCYLSCQLGTWCLNTQAKRATFPMQTITHTIAQLDGLMSLQT